MKTKYDSYCTDPLPDGCKYCVKGEKLVLFISGKCSRNCWYCSLSRKRKNKDIVWANERKIQNKESLKELIQEVRESRATSAGITGGDPLLFLPRTIRYARALKKEFGKKFHIHIYLPPALINEENLRKLSRCIDEVRLHPGFLSEKISSKDQEKEINKINLASKFFKKENIGIELPVFPDRKRETLDFILKIRNAVGFVNLNELEISETNSDKIIKKYRINDDGYTISGSMQTGIWIVNELEKANKKQKSRIRAHFCTARLKNWHQYKQRLLRHKVLPFGIKTGEGTVIYLAIYKNTERTAKKLRENSLSKFYLDKPRNRITISPLIFNQARKLFKIAKVEEHPTYDATVMDYQEV